MLKVLVRSSLRRVASRRIQQSAPLQHLPLGFHNYGEPHEKTSHGGEGMPLERWISRSSYSTGPKYEKKTGNGKGPPTVRQRRIASELLEVISEALQQGPCYNPVLQRCGFQILKVKMSSDLRTAHVLWTALPGMQRTAEKAAISKVLHLRSLVFERLNLPFSPVLKFQEDKPSEEMLALDEAFAKLREEEGEDQKLKESKGEEQDQSGTELGKEDSPAAPS